MVSLKIPNSHPVFPSGFMKAMTYLAPMKGGRETKLGQGTLENRKIKTLWTCGEMAVGMVLVMDEDEKGFGTN